MLSEDNLNQADVALLELLQDGRITAPYAAEELDYSKQYVRDRLRRLVEHNHVTKVYDGLYELESDPRPVHVQIEEAAGRLETILTSCKTHLQNDQPDLREVDNLLDRALDALDTYEQESYSDTQSSDDVKDEPA